MATLKDIDQKIELLKAQRARLTAASAKEERTRRTRQAVVVGGHVMAHMPDVLEQIKAGLTRPQDLELFGLSGLNSLCKSPLNPTSLTPR